MKKIKRGVGTGAILLALSNILCKGLGVAFKVPLANVGGGEAMACYQVGMSAFAFGMMAVTAGIPTAAARMIASAPDDARRGACRRAALVPALLFGGAVSAALFFFARPVAILAGKAEAEAAVRAIAPAVFACCVSSVLRACFQGEGRLAPFAVSQLAESSLRLAAGLWFAVSAVPFGPGAIAAGALTGVTVGEYAALLLLIFLSRRWERARGPLPLGELFSAALPLSVGAVIHSAASFGEGAVLLRRLTLCGLSDTAAAEQYGIYTGGVMAFFSIPPTLTSALCAAVLPAAAARHAKGGADGTRGLADRAMGVCVAVAMPFAACFALFAKPLLSIFYSRPGDVAVAAPLLAALAPGAVLLAVNAVGGAILTACGRPYAVAAAGTAGCAVRLAVCWVASASPAIGIAGAALGTLSGLLVTGACQLFLLYRTGLLGRSIPALLLRPLAAACIAGGASKFLVCRGVPGPVCAAVLFVLCISGAWSLDRGKIRSFFAKNTEKTKNKKAICIKTLAKEKKIC